MANNRSNILLNSGVGVASSSRQVVAGSTQDLGSGASGASEQLSQLADGAIQDRFDLALQTGSPATNRFAAAWPMRTPGSGTRNAKQVPNVDPGPRWCVGLSASRPTTTRPKVARRTT